MDVLRPFGRLDVLFYYSRVAEKLQGFLEGLELASKIWIPNGPQVIRRGSKLPPLWIKELEADEDFLKLRAEKNLKDVKGLLTERQVRVWEYFPPRKLADLFYATNGEGPGKPIRRIFFDIDRTDRPAEDALKVAKGLLQLVQEDGDFQELFSFKPWSMWTGSSFHVYLFLEKPIRPETYQRYIHYSKNQPEASFTGRWARELSERLGLEISGGHEKQKGKIVIDPSQTPSGKLARAPFSLHMRDAKTVDGVAVPVDLKKADLEELRSLKPETVLKKLERYSKLL